MGGARPNFVKIAALSGAFRTFKKDHPRSRLTVRIVHTGQHYHFMLVEKFFRDLNIPKPYRNLGVGSDSHAAQTAKIMIAFEKFLLTNQTDLVVVFGDVNSTLACSLVAKKMEIPIAHVESGMRSFDRTMPEEVNRTVTDGLSDFLFTTCEDANRNLLSEGIDKEKIFFVGNVMVDTLLAYLEKAVKSTMKQKLRLEGPYSILTLHRPSNVDQNQSLLEIIKALEEIQRRIKIVFPVHPRTALRLRNGRIGKRIGSLPNLLMVPAMGYLDFIHLMKDAKLVMTDSGGIQEETTVLGVPCLTLRENTERPVTIHEGTNVLAGKNSDRIVILASRILDRSTQENSFRNPPRWDGKAACRIVDILSKKFGF